jgi:hypothetical protein
MTCGKARYRNNMTGSYVYEARRNTERGKLQYQSWRQVISDAGNLPLPKTLREGKVVLCYMRNDPLVFCTRATNLIVFSQ